MMDGWLNWDLGYAWLTKLDGIFQLCGGSVFLIPKLFKGQL